MDWLGTASSIMGLANSAKSLFGGGGSSEGDSMKRQVAWQQYSAQVMPKMQVAGLREAGLNPMLAVANGISAPPPVTSSPGKDTELATAKQLAAATTANQLAQAKLYTSQAENVEADTQDKLLKPDETRERTNLLKAQAATEAWGPENRKWATELLSAQYGKTVAEKDAISIWQRKLTEAQTLVGERNAALLLQEIRSAKTKADVDEALLKLERIVAMGSEATGAVTGGLANSARALLGNKPKTIIQKAPNITIRNK